jgi:hypothetical protein
VEGVAMRFLTIFCNIIVALNFCEIAAASDQPRIQEMFLNKSSPQKIYLVPGLASSIKMPCEIDEVVTPTNGIMKHLSERNRSRFSLEVAAGSRSANFIVHCVSSTYVFDIVVNQKIHNDYIEVIGDYGKPRLTQTPPRMEKQLLQFSRDIKSDSNVVIGTNGKGESVTLKTWSNDSTVDYSQIPRTKIYDSKTGASDAH